MLTTRSPLLYGVVDANLRRSMLRYYDERAPEYEEAYLVGTGTASIPDQALTIEHFGATGGHFRRFADASRNAITGSPQYRKNVA